jgi:hypothetical protein
VFPSAGFVPESPGFPTQGVCTLGGGLSPRFGDCEERERSDPKDTHRQTLGAVVLTLGVILLIVGFLLSVPVLWSIGLILALIGGVLWLAQSSGAAWGRRWY